MILAQISCHHSKPTASAIRNVFEDFLLELPYIWNLFVGQIAFSVMLTNNHMHKINYELRQGLHISIWLHTNQNRKVPMQLEPQCLSIVSGRDRSHRLWSLCLRCEECLRQHHHYISRTFEILNIKPPYRPHRECRFAWRTRTESKFSNLLNASKISLSSSFIIASTL